MKMEKEIRTLQNLKSFNDENYKKLSEALNEYHRLVEAGVWIPRERMVDDIYKVYPFSCNGNALYQGNVVYQQYNS